MAIDVNRDRLLSLADAARRIPGRCGRPVTKKTVWIWTTRGCRGVRLDATFVGGELKTSEEALSRFTAAMDAKRGRSQKPRTKPATNEALRKEFGINVTEQTDGHADQGSRCEVSVGEMGKRQGVAR